MTEDQSDPLNANHAYMIVAAALTAAIATNRPGIFAGANAVYDAYLEIYQRVRLDGTDPLPLQPGQKIV
jgi:hypothetical protein